MVLFLSACQGTGTGEPADHRESYYEEVDSDPSTDLQLLSLKQTEEDISYYDEDIQASLSNEIKSLQEKSQSFEDAIFIRNPFGTFTQSIYSFIPDPDERIERVEYHIQAETASDFTAKAINQARQAQAFEFIIMGLVPGVQNQLHISLYDEQDELIHDYDLNIHMPAISLPEYGQQVEIIESSDHKDPSQGWVSSMGSSQKYAKYSYMFDNEGTIRSELASDGGRLENIEKVDDQHFLIKVSNEKLILMNALGQPERVYYIEDYSMHHDFALNDDKTGAFLLTNELQAPTIEDTVLYLDLKTGEYEEIIDLKDLLSGYFDPVMANYQANAQAYKDQLIAEGKDWQGEITENDSYASTYFNEEGELNDLDWIHINSIDVLNGDELVLSARENSSIIKFSNVLDQPELDYIIGRPEVWQGSGYENYLLQAASSFKPTGGQHAVFFQSNGIDDGHYDLTLFDNNYWRMNSRPDFTAPVPAGMQDDEGTLEDPSSYHYTLRVDEKNRTYDLVQQIEIPYSPIVSSSQVYRGHFITNSGTTNILGEYDQNGELIRQYAYDIPSWSYRIKKLDQRGFFFE